MADEASGGLASVQVPEPQGVVPGACQGELAVRGDDDVLYEVRVPLEGPLGVAVLGVLPGEAPQQHCLVPEWQSTAVKHAIKANRLIELQEFASNSIDAR